MAPTSTRSWILAKKPNDLPTFEGADANFKLETRDLPSLGDNQVLVQAIAYSNDPAQRGWISPNIKADRLYTTPVAEGTPMHARALAKVVESTSDRLKAGQTVTASMGWSEYAVLDAKAVVPVSELPGGLKMTQYLGALGGTGMTAYYGLVVIAEAKASDTVVVSGAAGATGSMVVQIAKHLVGCKRVIGIAGSAEKCKWVESIGADECLNYKDSDFKEKLTASTKDFADIYFDNVGGAILDMMLGRMARYGRIAACGAISDYNSSPEKMYGIKNWFEVVSMRIQIRGFIILDYLDHAAEMLGILKKGIEEGKLKISEENEHVVDTKFEDVPRTWLTLFEGGNTGKLVTMLV